jgi:CheY-like chemotaxis protein
MVACPGCGRRYRLDATRFPPGRRARCLECGNVFVPAPPARPAPAGIAVSGSATPARGHPERPLALVADEDREFRDLLVRTLAALGCRVETTDDGEAAFRLAVARRPDLMILNVYLKKLLGVAVCEGVKGSPDLRATRVALIGTVFKSGRFVRRPGNLYGADDYFEDVLPEREIRERLEGLLRGRRASARLAGDGAAAGGGAPRPAALDPAEEAAVEALGSGPSRPAPAAPPKADSEEHLDPRQEIHRLARIMISDLKIYHPEEFRRALLERTFSSVFREEMTQARDLIVRRFPELPDRLEILTAALKGGLGQERAAAARPAAGR